MKRFVTSLLVLASLAGSSDVASARGADPIVTSFTVTLSVPPRLHLVGSGFNSYTAVRVGAQSCESMGPSENTSTDYLCFVTPDVGHDAIFISADGVNFVQTSFYWDYGLLNDFGWNPPPTNLTFGDTSGTLFATAHADPVAGAISYSSSSPSVCEIDPTSG